MTFPRDASQLPLYYNFKTSGRGYNYVDMPFKPLYSFGYGLSYTQFRYSGEQITPHADGMLEVRATVTNIGKREGDEVIQLYVTDMYASVKTRVMELKDFQRIHLKAGESQEVGFALTPYQLSLLNDNMDRVVEPSQFRIMVGGRSPDFTAADKIKNSVGYRDATHGVTDSLDYTGAYRADFTLTPGDIVTDSITHRREAPVVVANRGNLTDVGKVTLYVNGVGQGDVHHFELAPGAAKTIFFPLEGTEELDCIFTTKYKSASRKYTL
jgi:beta-glucosidase